MTRREVLTMLILRARSNGFEFRKWYQTHIEPEWKDFETAVAVLDLGHRYYALIFSHVFARKFWKEGEQLTFLVPATSYTRNDGNGNVITVTRKAFTRRSLKADVWRYHLREMATHEEPLRYIRRFLLTKEEMQRVNKTAR